MSKALAVVERGDALVLGPGLESPRSDALREVLDESSMPTVVDTTAIGAALNADLGTVVCTPDSHEIDWIADQYGSLDAFSRVTGAVVVSKSAKDEIIGGTNRWTNDVGSPR